MLSKVTKILAIISISLLYSCQPKSLSSFSEASANGNPAFSDDPFGPPKDDAPDLEPPAADPGSGGGSQGTGTVCKGEDKVTCLGGFDADSNGKTIPTKVLFFGVSPADKDALAQELVDKGNNELKVGDHTLLRFEFSEAVTYDAISRNEYMNSTNMINTYGSTDHYVIALVKGLLPPSGGTIGYSPGLRINWKTKRSIVVMDYDFVRDGQNGDPNYGKTVLVHEIFHALGAPHTCDGNGSSDNTLRSVNGALINGFVNYNDISLITQVDNTFYDFNIYVEDNIQYLGARTVSNAQGDSLVFDTRTIMYQFARPYSLFNAGNEFDTSYSNILNSYYQQFVKE